MEIDNMLNKHSLISYGLGLATGFYLEHRTYNHDSLFDIIHNDIEGKVFFTYPLTGILSSTAITLNQEGSLSAITSDSSSFLVNSATFGLGMSCGEFLYDKSFNLILSLQSSFEKWDLNRKINKRLNKWARNRIKLIKSYNQ